MNEMHGRYSASIRNKNGSVVRKISEFDNVICDSAFNYALPFHEAVPVMVIGSGVVTNPSPSDTNLGNQVGAQHCTEYGNSGISGRGTGPALEYYDDESGGTFVKITWTAEFDGPLSDISEVGLRYGSATGALLSRSLIKNSSGTATTLSIQSGQILDLSYHLYVAVPSDGVFGSGTITTPHGSSTFEVKTPSPYTWPSSYIFTPSYGAILFMGGMVPTDRVSKADLMNVNSATMGTTIQSSSYDIETKSGSVTLYVSPLSSDKTFDRIDIYYSGYSNQYYNATTGIRNNGSQAEGARIKLATPITIPKDYDFTITLQFQAYTPS
jgi:hypothetical protein|tara:strand:- start:1930 stop:2904 length:975 start_codon:yes stop_codon:yes gene_type:complete